MAPVVLVREPSRGNLRQESAEDEHGEESGDLPLGESDPLPEHRSRHPERRRRQRRGQHRGHRERRASDRQQRAKPRRPHDFRRARRGERQRQQRQAAEHRQNVVGDVVRRAEIGEHQLRAQRGAHVRHAVGAHGPAAGLVGDLGVQPRFDHRVASGDADARSDSHRHPGIGILAHGVHQRADRAQGGERGEGARMPDEPGQARRPQAADEEAQKVRRSEQADLARREAERRARQRVERPETARGELEQDDRQEKGRERNQRFHGTRHSGIGRRLAPKIDSACRIGTIGSRGDRRGPSDPPGPCAGA